MSWSPAFPPICHYPYCRRQIDPHDILVFCPTCDQLYCGRGCQIADWTKYHKLVCLEDRQAIVTAVGKAALTSKIPEKDTPENRLKFFCYYAGMVLLGESKRLKALGMHSEGFVKQNQALSLCDHMDRYDHLNVLMINDPHHPGVPVCFEDGSWYTWQL